MIAARLLLPSLLVSGLVACSTATRRDASPSTAPTDAPAIAPDASTPTPTPTPTPAPAATPAPQAEPPKHDPITWIDPPRPLVLATLTNEQQARSNACIEAHDIRSPTATPTAMMAAADCLAAIPAPGNEIRLYKLLVETSPAAPEALEATRRLGARLEQIDARDQAAATYAEYLRRWPAQADARALAQRAVCLARSLGDEARVDALLADLERFYGLRGFTRPGEDALAELCAPLPAIAPRPG